MSRRLIALSYTSILALLIVSLAFGGEVRKLGSNDLEWGYGTTTSPAGKVVTKIPYPLAGLGTTADNSVIIDVRAYGAVAEDDTIQAAIDAATAGSVVFVPRSFGPYAVDDGVTIDKSIILYSDGATLNVASGKTGIEIASDNVTVDGFVLVGPARTPQDLDGRGISISATSGASPYSNIVIRNNTISTFEGYGIYTRNIKDFYIVENKIDTVNYGGILIHSSVSGVVNRNIIDNVSAPTDGYGIELTRNESDDLTTYPQSADIVVSNNIVRNNPTWKCYGTHGGIRITFVGNIGYNCLLGISCGASDNGASLQTWAPKDIAIIGNTLDSGVTDGSALYGINLTGARPSATVDHATGVISGNIINNYGGESDNTFGAIYIHSTLGVAITGNSIIQPAGSGIYMSYQNYGFNITGNTFRDVWSDTEAPAGIYIPNDYQYGVISGNSFQNWTKTATYLNGIGIYMGNNSHSKVVIGKNAFSGDFTTPVQDDYLWTYGTEFTGYVTYDPPAIDNGASVSQTISVPGAHVSDVVSCAHGGVNAAGIYVVGSVIAADNVSCTIVNLSGSTVNLSSSSLQAVVRRR